MGETRVDLVHLLEDLRDAYPGALEETILTELVANALDSGATAIRIAADPVGATLTVTDDGRGMQRRELRRFHDIAASTKVRGEGIGFAGVGVKLALLLSDHVLTETRRGKTHVATRWHLASRHRAPWKWIPATGTAGARGTAVILALRNPLSPLVDAGYVEGVVRRHYQPFFEPEFREMLAPWYPEGVTFHVNAQPLVPLPRHAAEVAPLAVRIGRKRKAAAAGYLARDPEPLAEAERGLAVSTLGKVIKRGWDWLGLTPAGAQSIGGLIEVPALAACLTLNKADFIRVGVRGATYLEHRKVIQEAVSQQLAAWGDARDGAPEARRRVARPLERDLERVLLGLAGDFPLIATLVEQRTDGQRRLPLAGKRSGDGRMVLAGIEGARRAGAPEEAAGAGAGNGTAPAADETPGQGASREPASPPAADSTVPEPAVAAGVAGSRAGGHARRAPRLGLGIQFEERPDDPELGHLLESTVWVNTAHPAYRRATAARSEGYHVALTAALALARLAVEPAAEHAFVTAFLARWGELAHPAAGRRDRTR